MKLVIYGNRDLSTVQEEFSEFFPFLKLEFYSGGRQSGNPVRLGLLQIKKCREEEHNGIIGLSPFMTVGELENCFAGYGLDVKVFVRSGNLWLDTFHKTHSLRKKNHLGEVLSRLQKIPVLPVNLGMDIRHYDLQPIEDDYRKLTAQDDHSAAERLKNFFETIRYELRMDAEVIFEYRHDHEAPMTMRILRNEKDLDRWIEARFIRLGEFF